MQTNRKRVSRTFRVSILIETSTLLKEYKILDGNFPNILLTKLTNLPWAIIAIEELSQTFKFIPTVKLWTPSLPALWRNLQSTITSPLYIFILSSSTVFLVSF